MLTKSTISGNLKKWGFKSHDAAIDEALNKALSNHVEREVKKSKPEHCLGYRQSGGRVIQSSEWYGVDSGKYTADADAGNNLTVTDQYIRPPLSVHDPSGGLVGGASKQFVSTYKAVKEEVASHKKALNAKRIQDIKENFDSKMTELFNSVSKKTKGEDHLTSGDFRKVWNQKKYSKYH